MKTLRAAIACGAVLCLAAVEAQPRFENTFVWETGFDHSGWKALSNFPTGYVMAGTKFFEPNNTRIFMTGFNDLCQHDWTTTHTTDQHGFTNLNVFWKTITTIGAPSSPSGFFVAATGTRAEGPAYYTLQTHKTGQRVNERFGAIGNGVQFGGACQARDGGFIVVGTDGMGKIALARFNPAGELVTTTALAIEGFAWTVQPASGGGYVLGSTSARATRIDESFNVDWTTTLTLPAAPPPDGSSYTYSEFEEIIPLQNSASGFVMTGSIFSNSHSGVYTSRLEWNGAVAWAKVNETTNTSLAQTPVSWANSPIELYNTATGVWDLIFTWRVGPVSAGGALMYERMNPSNGATLQAGSLMNNIPVQEAFTVRQYFLNRIVVAGTRGGYSAVYSYATSTLP